jgi:hypothetical protein
MIEQYMEYSSAPIITSNTKPLSSKHLIIKNKPI